MSQLKWKWWVDLTQPNDNFDDAEIADQQAGLQQAIADGYGWTREEERVGRWLGLFIAVVFWAIMILAFFASHPFHPNGTVIMPDGRVILPLDDASRNHENSRTR
ncbi:MAG: hypothetical protein WC919_00265 [Candidatus Paceibacterota bacterium]|jgi:hypothetical protein